ncbi:2OG-Fe dioxygenase family protein [Aerolutibacter ruishenii]|nr:2OG-Fe dioxygenase family protein [Lysobacter ruishenii]
MSPASGDCHLLELALREDGFAFIGAGVMRALLGNGRAHAAQAWAEFAASWGDLADDNYLAKVGLRRRRRHAVFTATADGDVQRAPHQPHYQSRDYNTLQGGIERWFEPIRPEVADSLPMRRLLGFAHALFGRLAPHVGHWHVEAHQFRIEALPEHHGQPTPEGMHRDGVNFVMVVLLDRHNITSGTTSIHALDGGEIGSFTLTRPLDTAFVDDGRVYHGVTAVAPLDPAQAAWRDVLVVTFRAIAEAV